MNLTMNCGLISLLFLISKLLKDLFNLVAIDLEELANLKFNQHKLDNNIHNFNLIADDLIRCDYFFSQFNFYNYYMAMIISSFTFLTGQ